MTFTRRFFRAAAVCSFVSVATTLPALLDAWLYPVMQPVAHTLIGLWLWRAPPLDFSPALRQDRR